MFQRELQGICRTHGSMLNGCELWCLTSVIVDKASSISAWQLYMRLRLAKQATTTAATSVLHKEQMYGLLAIKPLF